MRRAMKAIRTLTGVYSTKGQEGMRGAGGRHAGDSRLACPLNHGSLPEQHGSYQCDGEPASGEKHGKGEFVVRRRVKSGRLSGRARSLHPQQGTWQSAGLMSLSAINGHHLLVRYVVRSRDR